MAQGMLGRRGKIRRSQHGGQNGESGSSHIEGTLTQATDNTQPHAGQGTNRAMVTGGISKEETEKKEGQRGEPLRAAPMSTRNQGDRSRMSARPPTHASQATQGVER